MGLTKKLRGVYEHWEIIEQYKKQGQRKWFRRGEYEGMEEVGCGALRLRPKMEFKLEIDRKAIFAMFGTPQMWKSFSKNGICFVQSGIPHITEDPRLRRGIDLEFQLLRHHGNEDTDGQLWVSCHSILQQTLRQDPIIYALTVAAREDVHYRLVSIPVQSEAYDPGDEGKGRFFATNVGNALEEGSTNFVQSEVILSEESGESCTTFVPGFHECLEEWWPEHHMVGQEEDVPYKVEPYGEEEEDLLGEEKKVVGRMGTLCISCPDVLVGSLPGKVQTVQIERCTATPCFTAIDMNGNLETGIGNVREVAEAHIRMISMAQDRFGNLLSTKQRMTEAMPSMPKIQPVWAIGAAILGLESWESSSVKRELGMLFSDKGREFAEKVREDLRKAMQRAYKTLLRSEREDYGPDSWVTMMMGAEASPEASGSRRRRDAESESDERPLKRRRITGGNVEQGKVLGEISGAEEVEEGESDECTEGESGEEETE